MCHMVETIEKVEFYIRAAQQAYRLFVYLRRYFRRRIDKAREEHTRKVMAMLAPKIFWAGFALAVLVGLGLFSAIYGSRQLR